MKRKKHILVTGGAGYIGSHTVIQLVNQGYIPVIVDDLRNANPVVREGLRKIIGFEPIIERIDCCNNDSLSKVFQSYPIEGIIHFAADKAVGESVANPLKYYHNNIAGLVNVCSLALQFGVSDFVFSSSCTVYGEPEGIKEVTEEMAGTRAESPYGFTKIIGEQVLKDTQHAFPQLRVINLRYFNPVGAHPTSEIGEFPIGKPNNLLPYITQTAAGKLEQLTVFGNDYSTPDGTCIRDYIHVVDLAGAHVAALDFLNRTEGPLIEAINIGTGKGTSVLEMIHTFEKVSEKELNWQYGARRPGDVVEIYANADKARRLLGWQAKLTAEDAIRDAWNWELKLASHG
jgi:UDP-glucose 4-epimerase